MSEYIIHDDRPYSTETRETKEAYPNKKLWLAETKFLMKHAWKLPGSSIKHLDTLQLFTMDAEKFLEKVEPEEYPISFEDSIRMEGSEKFYRITYIYCSPEWLHDWLDDVGIGNVTFQLRINHANKFFQCLVRPNVDRYPLEEAIRQGAVRL